MHTPGIVIVTYNSEDVIAECLEAACKFVTASSIVVVDNASHDHTVKVARRFPVRLIENRENSGFAAAVNQGIRFLQNEFVLILNPDAILLAGLDSLCDVLHNPENGCVGGMLVDSQNAAQTGFTVRRFPTVAVVVSEALLLNRLWPSNPINWHYRCLDVDLNLAQDVDQPAGAFLMISRSAWKAVGGFDESFRPVWFEDVDFCKRVRDAGFTIRYQPEARALHQGGHSVNRLSWDKRQIYWYRNVLTYSAKHFPSLGGRLVCLAILVGVSIRGIVGMFTERNFKPLAGWWWVSRLALLRFFAWPANRPVV